MSQKIFSFAVVGAGPGGLTAVGLLLDAGVQPDDILWIDPDFQVGDFGKQWGEVNSNTKVALFQDYLSGISSFEYAHKNNAFALDAMDRNQFTLLKSVAESLKWVTAHLQKKVHAVKNVVRAMKIINGAWELNADNENYFARKVILATGSEPKSLDFPGIEEISLSLALTPSKLKTACQKEDVVAVFGSSHSAMIVIRNLIECGVKKVINFYQSPLKYALPMQDWILYDDTGLKGETAQWVRENISQHCLPNIDRYLSTPEHIDMHLSFCNKAVYAVGFQQRHIPISGVSLSHYDQSNGIIAPGLFGIGIGFPIAVIDPFGHIERNVGLWKFLKNMKKALPIWLQYGL